VTAARTSCGNVSSGKAGREEGEGKKRKLGGFLFSGSVNPHGPEVGRRAPRKNKREEKFVPAHYFSSRRQKLKKRKGKEKKPHPPAAYF